MDIYKKLEREKIYGLWKVIAPFIIFAAAGYFLHALIIGGFFIGWEKYFAFGCYTSIFFVLLIADISILNWLYYDIIFEDDKIRIKDSFFTRAIVIPLDRIYYISSIKLGSVDYDSIIIIDKKIHHKKIKRLSEDDFIDHKEHIKAVRIIKDLYPDKTFYYYRIRHHGYKFFYYFYFLYKSCDRCKFSNTSMELVKIFAEQI